MGTKIEYVIDRLAITQTNTSTTNSFKVFRVDEWDYFRTRELNKFQRTEIHHFRNSMDRRLEKHNIDSIKRTMQIHEDIFKHQVQELHRLYSVQKMLMSELKKELKQNRMSNSMASSDKNHSQFINRHSYSTAQTTTSGFVFQVHQNATEQPSSRERSGSCSGETLRMPIRSFVLERPAAVLDDMATGISGAIDHHQEDQAGPAGSPIRQISNKMSIDGSDEESEVELTLSIGVSSSKKRPKNNLQPLHSQELGCLESPHASFRSDRGEDCSCPNTPMSSSSATFDQDKKIPHWLFGLSINRST